MPYLCIKKCKFEGKIYKEGSTYEGSSKELPHHFKEVGETAEPVQKKTATKGGAK